MSSTATCGSDVCASPALSTRSLPASPALPIRRISSIKINEIKPQLLSAGNYCGDFEGLIDKYTEDFEVDPAIKFYTICSYKIAWEHRLSQSKLLPTDPLSKDMQYIESKNSEFDQVLEAKISRIVDRFCNAIPRS